MAETLFLVHIQVRGTDIALNACGYSTASLLALKIIAGLLVTVTFIIILPRLELRIPFAAASSLAISAACHPPANDANAHLQEVQWGVVEGELNETGVGHCTFTSKPVTAPQVGKIYA